MHRTTTRHRRDRGSTTQLIGVGLAGVALIMAFATGFSISIDLGDTGGDVATGGISGDAGAPGPVLGGDAIDLGFGGDAASDASGPSSLFPSSTAAPSSAGGSGTSTGSAGSAGSTGTTAPAPSGSGSVSAAPPANAGAGQSAPTTAASEPAPAETAPATAPTDTAPAPSSPSARFASSPPPASACTNLGDNDQGITAETIKLGLLIPNLDDLRLAGFPIGTPTDTTAIVDAWVAEMNRTGVACRQVEWVRRSFDVTSGDDMQRVCKEMIQDEQVFSVITPGGYDSVAQLCVAKEGQTPLINPEAEPAHWYRDAAPYLWNYATSKDRGHINHVRYLVEHGHITADTKIGVIYDGTPHVAPATEAGLLPELDRQGLDAEVFKLSSDTEQALGQISQAVVDFQLAGVNFVFMPMNLIYKTQFMQSAENQNYFPQYTDSDHNFGCFDFTTSTYPARSFQDTICVTTTDVVGRVDIEEFTNNMPFTKYADEVYFRLHGPDSYHADGPGTDNWNAQKSIHVAMGSLFKMWEQAANRAGPGITRASWGQAMTQTGVFDACACEFPLFFDGQKFDGSTTVKGLIWKAEASDGFKERQFRELTRPQEAYAQRFIP